MIVDYYRRSYSVKTAHTTYFVDVFVFYLAKDWRSDLQLLGP
jgi:hypothetical protein